MFPCVNGSYLTDPATAIRREGYAERIRIAQIINGSGTPAVALNFIATGSAVRMELYIHQYTTKPPIIIKAGLASSDGLEMGLVLTATELQALPANIYTEQVWLRDNQGNETLLAERTLTLQAARQMAAGSPALRPATTVTINKSDRLIQVILDRAVVVINTGSGGVTGHTHVQVLPASVWTITHALGYSPAGIQVQDSAGTSWLPDSITYPDVNTVILTFGTAGFSGRAYLS